MLYLHSQLKFCVRGQEVPSFIAKMLEKSRIENLVKEHLAGTDKFLVDLTVSPSNKIEIYIDGMNGVSIKDCVSLSRHVEGSLDREEEDFYLDVSSPGAEEPFKVKEQFEKNKGRKVKITTTEGKEHTGILQGLQQNNVLIDTTEKKTKLEGKGKILVTEQLTLELDKVKEARVILSFK